MSIEDELFDAVKDGDKLKIESLLDKNRASIYARDEQGNTLLHTAALLGYYDIISLLIEKKIRTNEQNYLGWTPLHLAVLSNNTITVSILLELCLKFDIGDEDGNLPIHLAAEMGYVEIIELLYGDKDTINEKNKHGFTPLHLAVQKGCKKAVEMLICGGTDLDVQDGGEKGDTALIMAVKEDHVPIAKLLLDRGADYNKTNNAGETFGAFARSEEMINIVSKYDEFSDSSIPSPSAFKLPSRKRKAFSDISNTSSSSSSDRARICKRRRAIDEILDSPMSCTADDLMHESGCRSNLPDDLESLNSTFSGHQSIKSTDIPNISSPESNISDPVSKCQNLLQVLNLHHSAPSSPSKVR